MRVSTAVLCLFLLSATALVADEPPLEPIPLPAPVPKATEPTPATPPAVRQAGLQTPLEGPVFPDSTTVIVEEGSSNSELQPMPAQESLDLNPRAAASGAIVVPPASTVPAPTRRVIEHETVVPARPRTTTTYRTTQSYYVTPLGRVIPAQRVVYYQAAPPAVGAYRVVPGSTAVLNIQVAPAPVVAPPPGYVPGQPVRNLIRSMRW